MVYWVVATGFDWRAKVAWHGRITLYLARELLQSLNDEFQL